MNFTTQLGDATGPLTIAVRFDSCAGACWGWLYDANGQNPQPIGSTDSAHDQPLAVVPRASEARGRGVYVLARTSSVTQGPDVIGVTVQVRIDGAVVDSRTAPYVASPNAMQEFPFTIEFR